MAATTAASVSSSRWLTPGATDTASLARNPHPDLRLACVDPHGDTQGTLGISAVKAFGVSTTWS